MKLTKRTKGFPKTTPYIQQKEESSYNPIPTEAEAEDYNFDFSLYEQEDKQDLVIESIKDIENNVPKITNYKSKYGISMQINETILLPLRQEITKHSIKVASRTEEGSDLWMLYGYLEEYWSAIIILFGTTIREEIRIKLIDCKKELEKQMKSKSNDYTANDKLIELKNKIYMLSQRAGLGIDVEKIYNYKSQARQGIVE